MPNFATIISAGFDFDLAADEDIGSMADNALIELTGTDVDWQDTGLPRRHRRIRSWLTMWPDRASAEAYLHAYTSDIPLITKAREHVAGLLAPYASHGDVNWQSTTPAPLALDLSPRPEKGSPVFVVTSLAFAKMGEGAIAFGKGNHAIRRIVSDQPGLLFEAQILADNQNLDGSTLTLWEDEAAMMRFAYREDPHRTSMKVKEHEDIARGSFTRLAVLSFSGAWNGKQIAIDRR